MSQIPRFLALLSASGSDVQFHRDDSMVPCPCRTPEGFRDPIWHLEHPPGEPTTVIFDDFPGTALSSDWAASPANPDNNSIVVSNGHVALKTTAAGGSGYANLDWNRGGSWQIDFSEGGAAVVNVSATPVPVGATAVDAYMMLVNGLKSYQLARRGNNLVAVHETHGDFGNVIASAPYNQAAMNWWRIRMDLATLKIFWEYSADGVTWTQLAQADKAFDWNPLGLEFGCGTDSMSMSADTFVIEYVRMEFGINPPVCNENGMLPGTPVDVIVKAFMQPIQSTRATRLSTEQLIQMFGEIQADDHLGIFPCEWASTTLDFYGWGRAGEDYLVYNGRKFTVVNSNLIPDPSDGNPAHHWEIGARLIS